MCAAYAAAALLAAHLDRRRLARSQRVKRLVWRTA